MSEQRPAHDQVDASWRTALAIERPVSNDLNPTWSIKFSVTTAWRATALDYLALVEWAEDDAATQHKIALEQNGEIVSFAFTTYTNHVFSGLTPHTSYVVVLTPYSGDEPGLVQYQDVATGAGLPGAMDGVDYTFTESSLTPAWPAVEDADGYVVALFRDGVELDRADVTGTSATFEGLEDGTRYTLSFYAYNAQGQGPEATGYDATTAFLIPSPPSNIRQDGEMIIGISTLWDAPIKTNQLHIQLFYGDQVLYDEYAPGTQTARVFPVPMASTNYLLRIRSGNPAGWSEWSETAVYTEKYPLIDSRLGVMATTYQEGYLYPDTWDGGTDLAGVGSPEEKTLTPSFHLAGEIVGRRSSHAFSDRVGVGVMIDEMTMTNRDPTIEFNFQDRVGIEIGVSDFLVSSRLVTQEAAQSDRIGIGIDVSGLEIYSLNRRYTASALDRTGIQITVSSFQIDTTVE